MTHLTKSILIAAVGILLCIEVIPIVRVAKQSLGWVELGYVVYFQEKSTDHIGPDTLAKENIVAHAGGRVETCTLTNTVEALNESYGRGRRFMEIDFEWTSDNQLVCIHDWEQTWQKYFSGGKDIPDRMMFLHSKMKGALTQMDIRILVDWVNTHRDCYIITDVKSRNLSALETIKNQYPAIRENIIPQIYRFYEYRHVMDMGYKRVILTLYRSNYWDSQVISFTQHNEVFAVTMFKERAYSTLPTVLSSKGVFVYMHTTNSLDEYTLLKKNGVGGIYSDSL